MSCRFYSIRRAKVTHFCYFHNTPIHTHCLLLPATLRLLNLCNQIHRQVSRLQIPLIPTYFLYIFQEQRNTSVLALRTRSFSRSPASFHGLLYFHTPRMCLKKAFCKMCVTICGRFLPDEGAVAGYGNRIRVKYTAKWGVQIAGMIFQTRSRIFYFLIKIL